MSKSLVYGAALISLLSFGAHGQQLGSVLSRDEAAKQIVSALTDKPIRWEFNLTFPVYDPEEIKHGKLQSLYAQLTDPKSHPDQDPHKMVGDYFVKLRLLWTSGLADHLSIDTNKGEIVATLKDDVKSQCAFTMDPSHRVPICNLPIAQKQLDKVTGISSAYDSSLGREYKIVDFSETSKLTDIGRLLNLNDDAPHPAQAFFLLYDDGWRLVRISG